MDIKKLTRTGQILSLIIFFFAFISCSEEEVKVNHLELLAGTESKTWYLHSMSPENSLCPSRLSVYADNTYTFYPDGSFEFNNGEIEATTDCNLCCLDFPDMSGYWELTNDEKGMRVFDVRDKLDPDNQIISVDLINGSFKSISDNKLIMIQPDPYSSKIFVTEYHTVE